MSFKQILVILFCSLGLLSCSEFLSGQKQEEQVLKVDNSQFKCLDQVPESFRRIMDKDSHPEQLESSLDCLASALDYFKKKTKASYEKPDSYTINNIRSFFGDYLGNQNLLSDEMALQLMKVKKAFFGGSEVSITKTELQLLIDFIRDLKLEIKNLRPVWNIILGKQEGRIAQSALNQANESLSHSLLELLKKTELKNEDYTFEDFESLIRELEKFIRTSPTQADVDLVSWMPLMEAIKANLFGDIVEMNSLSRWKQAINTITELHRFYLLYKYQFEPNSLFTRHGLQTMDEMIVLLLNLLDRSWVLQNGLLSFETSKLLFEKLEAKNLLPYNITAPAIDQAYRAIVRKVLERERKNPDESVVGLERTHVRALKLEYEIWKAAQNFIETMPDQFGYHDMLARLSDYKLQVPSRFTGISRTLVENSWKEFATHLDQPRPLLYSPSGDLIISRDVKIEKNWNWYSLARLNAMRTLSRILLLGYGQNRNQNLTFESLNEQGMKTWYDDFELLGVQIKAFDPRSSNAGTRSFFEADHFVFASNGDDKIDNQEAFELINIIFSAGLGGLQDLQGHLKRSGCLLPEKDVFDFNWSEEKCFKKVLRSKFGELFMNLEGLRPYVASMNDQQWEEFYNALMDFSRNDVKQKGLRIETADLRTMVVILHYIESMFIKFDSNKDDVLSKKELIEASEMFVSFFKTLYKLNEKPEGFFSGLWAKFKNWTSTPFIKQGFACVVLTSELPTLESCGRAFLQDTFREDQYASRLDILQTLNAFKSSIQ